MIDLNTPKYIIWDRQTSITTPSGKVYTAEEWLAKYPWARRNVAVISGDPVFNGAFMTPLVTLQRDAASKGCNFTECETNEDILNTIIVFNDNLNQSREISESTSDRIATAIEEYTSLLALIELNNLSSGNDGFMDDADDSLIEDFEGLLFDDEGNIIDVGELDPSEIPDEW